EAGGAAVEPDGGAAGGLATDLDLGPLAPFPPVAGPHRFEERLLGGEARRERACRHGDAEAVGELVGREQPAEPTVAAAFAESPEPGDRDEVDSRADDHGRNDKAAAPARRTRAVRNPGDARGVTSRGHGGVG